MGPSGWAFQPEGCGTAGRLDIACLGNTQVMDATRGPSTVEGDPFAVWASDECSTFGFAARDWQGRARRQLAASESYEVANELWTGSLGLTQRSLVDPASDTVTSGGVSALDALGAVEQGMAVCGKGRQGMIHCTPQLLTHLATTNIVHLEGNTWVSPNGHLVVPDAGYDGTGPGGVAAGATQWVYGTSMIALRFTDVQVTRVTPDSFDRATNLITVFAYRAATWVWDECCHVAAEVSLPVALIGGAS